MNSQARWLAIIAVVAVIGLGAMAITAWNASDDENRGDTATPSPGPDDAATASDPGEAVVAVVDNAFEPDRLVVTPGTTVTWEWQGDNPHRIVGTTPGDLDSGEMTSGSYDFTFDEEGQWEYHCSVHGPESMSGIVLVQGE